MIPSKNSWNSMRNRWFGGHIRWMIIPLGGSGPLPQVDDHPPGTARWTVRAHGRHHTRSPATGRPPSPAWGCSPMLVQHAPSRVACNLAMEVCSTRRLAIKCSLPAAASATQVRAAELHVFNKIPNSESKIQHPASKIRIQNPKFLCYPAALVFKSTRPRQKSTRSHRRNACRTNG